MKIKAMKMYEKQMKVVGGIKKIKQSSSKKRMTTNRPTALTSISPATTLNRGRDRVVSCALPWTSRAPADDSAGSSMVAKLLQFDTWEASVWVGKVQEILL